MNRVEKLERVEMAIRNVPDFPKKGIQFKDITTLLQDAEAFVLTSELLLEDLSDLYDIPTKIIGLESRGFLFGPMLAKDLKISFVPVRKAGKLPANTIFEDYELEYGSNRLEIHSDAIHAGDTVIIHDDLIATGGSANAARRLVERLGGRVIAYSFIIELSFLSGRDALGEIPVRSLITY